MNCSICGKSGHNRRSCTDSTLKTDEKIRDRALILRIDGMTEEEQHNMHIGIVELKKKLTSNEAKATLIEGSCKELPSKVKELIKGND